MSLRTTDTATSPTAPADQPPRALDGIRVVDLTQFEAGTTATQALAWLGADVIKVERPFTGDPVRRASRDRPDGDSTGFLVFNSNKRSVTLNLKHPKGPELLGRLLRTADVLVENFRPGTLERMGFGYAQLAADNPRLVYAQIKGFGRGSPYERFPAFDPIGQATGGAMSLTGEPDGPPMRSGVNLADSATGLHAAMGVVAALYQRQRTDRGQLVEVAMQDVVISLSRSAYGRYLTTGEDAVRVGNALHIGPSAPSNAYPCKPFGDNDYCYIHCSRAGNADWHRLLSLIGRNDLLDDERFATPQTRWEHRETVNALLTDWTRQRTKVEAMEQLGAANVPGGATFSTSELANHASLRARGVFVEVEHPYHGPVVLPGWPIVMSDSPVRVLAAPALGSGNATVYREYAGVTEDELKRLAEEGVV
jgi:formyl-CoA transferase